MGNSLTILSGIKGGARCLQTKGRKGEGKRHVFVNNFASPGVENDDSFDTASMG
jgi:hypothetical protein